ncbi:MAG: Hpt domain-containing protein [Rubrivivax sp.]|nr:Hpt domain-containing protein [Rubrivivax sp.]MBK8529083.1 Hpt domain-containing protein [Rubrivivax sp.]
MGFIRGRAADGPTPPITGADAGRPGGPSAVIDAAAIERLRELDPGGQQGVLQRVLHAYQVSLGRHLDEMAAALPARDSDRMARSAHTLKSSSAAIGALDFSQRCADLEHCVRTGQGLPPESELQALFDEGRRVLTAVEAMLAP